METYKDTALYVFDSLDKKEHEEIVEILRLPKNIELKVDMGAAVKVSHSDLEQLAKLKESIDYDIVRYIENGLQSNIEDIQACASHRANEADGTQFDYFHYANYGFLSAAGRSHINFQQPDVYIDFWRTLKLTTAENPLKLLSMAENEPYMKDNQLISGLPNIAVMYLYLEDKRLKATLKRIAFPEQQIIQQPEATVSAVNQESQLPPFDPDKADTNNPEKSPHDKRMQEFLLFCGNEV